jgi:hypothetical protein
MKMLMAGVACAMAVSTVCAQTSSTTTTSTTNPVTGTTTTESTTTSGKGVVTAYTPGSEYITFRSSATAEPVKYYYTKKTVLVDPEGRTMEWSALRPDMPVTYTYVRDGDRMVVTKVTVAKPVTVYKKEETTTTTTTKP